MVGEVAAVRIGFLLLLQPRSTPMDVPALERALKLATTASLPLPVAERPNFIGKWLLAEADGLDEGASSEAASKKSATKKLN